jgi:hypothetical protein
MSTPVESKVIAHSQGTARYDILADGNIQITIVEGATAIVPGAVLEQLAARAKVHARARARGKR